MARAATLAAAATQPAAEEREARAGKVRVAQVGTFDVENFGDLLFPLLARRALADRLPEVETVLYSYRSKSADEWPYEVRRLETLVEEIERYDLVLVGGGDIVRFDKEIAPGYLPSNTALHHPTSLWMAPTLLAAAHRIPVAWNAIGVPAECPGWAVPATRSVLSAVNYLAVRDQRSADRLGAVGSDTEIHVVADTAFAVRQLLPGRPSRAYRAQLDELGIEPPYLIVQPSPRLAPFAPRLQDGLQALRDDGWSIVELPIGPIHGDTAGSMDLGVETETPARWPNPELILELIGRSGGVVGVSLHLAIVASALGVPVARPADLTTSESKHAAVESLPGVSHWPSSGAGSISLPFGARRVTNGAGPDTQVSSLLGHWDEIAETAKGTGNLDRVIEFVLAVPGQLETAAKEVADGVALYRELYEKQAGIYEQQAAMLAAQEQSLAGERADRDRLRTQLAEREEEHQTLVADWARRQLELEQLRESLAALERQSGELASQLTAVTDERHSLSELLQASHSDRELLQARLAKSESAAAELAAAQSLVETLRTENAQTRELLQGTQADRARLTARTGELERAHAELVRSAAETEDWLRRLEGSRSWRATSPLRGIAGAFRRTFKRERLADETPPPEG
jgi:polysaccharide pyruvyl transferase WcaK-like protein